MAFDLNSAKEITSGFDLASSEPIVPDGKVSPSAYKPDMLESGLRGFANAATFGLAPQISAGVNSLFGNGDYKTNLKQYLDANRAAEQAHPGVTLAAGAGPSALQALATGGGSLARQFGVNAAMGAANAGGNSDKSGIDLAKDILVGGAVGGTLGSGPAALSKIGGAAEKYASKTASDTVETLLKNKPAGYKKELEKILGSTEAEMKIGGTTLLKDAKDMVTAIRNGEVKASDIPALSKDAISTLRPSWSKIGKDSAKTIKEAVIGGTLGAGANYATGGNIDPTTAMLGGALFGANKAARTAGGELLKRGATTLGTSNIPNIINKVATSRAGGAANQMMSQAATKDILQTYDQPTSPFGSLTSYLKQASGATNPAVQQVAEQAEGIAESNDPDAKRKAAMVLQDTPEGRAVGNSSSNVRDLD